MGRKIGFTILTILILPNAFDLVKGSKLAEFRAKLDVMKLLQEQCKAQEVKFENGTMVGSCKVFQLFLRRVVVDREEQPECPELIQHSPGSIDQLMQDNPNWSEIKIKKTSQTEMEITVTFVGQILKSGKKERYGDFPISVAEGGNAASILDSAIAALKASLAI